MGTRGFLGFVIDGTEKIGYNHYDSYPDWLGLNVLGWMRQVCVPNEASCAQLARDLVLVTEKTPITDDHMLKLAQYANTHVGNQGIHNQVVHDWYQLLRNTQGHPGLALQAGYMIDAHQFPLNSLFCEWGYLVDFDARVLECYRGFQTTPDIQGRWKHQTGHTTSVLTDTYYPVSLAAAYRFDELPADNEFTSRLDPPEE